MTHEQALKTLRSHIASYMQEIERQQLRLTGKYEAYSRSLDNIDVLLSEVEKENEENE